jgi:hypothetical protein
MELLVSYINDNNIFHVFAYDIIKYFAKYNTAIINSNDIDIESPVQKWRFFVMKKLYKNVFYSDNNTIRNNITHSGFNNGVFIEYNPCPHMCEIYKIISPPDIKQSEKFILFNQRNIDDRYLYDYDTKLKLEDFLLSHKFKIPIKVCNFNNIEPEEQYQLCNNCTILISAHGAGCTNIIFTQKDTPLIEINFRKHWYCDTVCDDHFYNNISVNEKCNGSLIYGNFHKADYHNLGYLLGKKYL